MLFDIREKASERNVCPKSHATHSMEATSTNNIGADMGMSLPSQENKK